MRRRRRVAAVADSVAAEDALKIESAESPFSAVSDVPRTLGVTVEALLLFEDVLLVVPEEVPFFLSASFFIEDKAVPSDESE